MRWLLFFLHVKLSIAFTDPRPMQRATAPATSGAATAAESAEALKFCCSSATAVVATVWPTAHSQASAARAWLLDSGAKILLEKEVQIAATGAVPTCMALYYGEDWLDSNCWYMESPLPEGPPEGPHAGAKWKAALTFRSNVEGGLSPATIVAPVPSSPPPPPMTVIVADAAAAAGKLWRTKYSIRDRLRSSVGALGNACLHITDDQASALRDWKQQQQQQQQGAAMTTGNGGGGGSGGGGSFACDSSYAFHCARVLLDDSSVAFLNSANVDSARFEENYGAYAAWLATEPDGNKNAPSWVD